MPDTRQHRGAHPEDQRLFAPSQLPRLRTAVFEFSWLLTRGYAAVSALKLVGDRHKLNKRQRVALSRAGCSDQEYEHRQATCLPVQQIRDQEVLIDGFNLLITIEAALSGGIVLWCRDGCLRDLSSVHGSYRTVTETQQAFELIGAVLCNLKPQSVTWLFDAPISNSGRLAQRIRTEAAAHGWPWNAEVVLNPDTALIASEQIAISSDSHILDGAMRWVNFSAYLLTSCLPDAWVIDLKNL
ncbi:hypothetical protein U27_01668 [Candidatus Vecturithrix granuli]|uniref:DUF434 domain-containing protein n=1 Tax=Vecturithrix granuli TaxID=1499967 RepID=A0A0S6W5D3_VECG1|nr:hypothetical protein U27_01668 [Candidatus Vecturithrix granuli]